MRSHLTLIEMESRQGTEFCLDRAGMRALANCKFRVAESEVLLPGPDTRSTWTPFCACFNLGRATVVFSRICEHLLLHLGYASVYSLFLPDCAEP